MPTEQDTAQVPKAPARRAGGGTRVRITEAAVKLHGRSGPPGPPSAASRRRPEYSARPSTATSPRRRTFSRPAPRTTGRSTPCPTSRPGARPATRSAPPRRCSPSSTTSTRRRADARDHRSRRSACSRDGCAARSVHGFPRCGAANLLTGRPERGAARPVWRRRSATRCSSRPGSRCGVSRASATPRRSRSWPA